MASKDQQINQLMDMGFGNNRVVRALQATQFKVAQFRFEKRRILLLSQAARRAARLKKIESKKCAYGVCPNK